MTTVAPDQQELPGQPTQHGRWLVVAMFLFATLVSIGLWTYWELHTRPFRELTDALGQQYPASNPRVEGGKHGMHRDVDRVLRIVLRIDYQPEQQPERYQRQLRTILDLAAQHVQLNKYDRCDIHLFRQRPEMKPEVTTKAIPRRHFPQRSSDNPSRSASNS